VKENNDRIIICLENVSFKSLPRTKHTTSIYSLWNPIRLTALVQSSLQTLLFWERFQRSDSIYQMVLKISWHYTVAYCWA